MEIIEDDNGQSYLFQIPENGTLDFNKTRCELVSIFSKNACFAESIEFIGFRLVLES